jgi:predicted nucleic acid-binding protein
MILADIPAGERIFVDANTLVYHFAADPQYGTACTDFVRRCQTEELRAFCSTHVVSDLAHRLMTIEAIIAFQWPIAGIAQRLRRGHSEIPKLIRYRQVIEQLPQSNLQVVPVTWPLVSKATAASEKYELLCGDALIVTIMEELGVTRLASNDADFDRVPWLVRYQPV